MNEEEKQAIDYFKNLDISFNTLLRIDLKGFGNAVNTILNLIEKQQKEIEDIKKVGFYNTGFDKGVESVENRIKAKLEVIRKGYNNIISDDNVSLNLKNINSHRYDAMSIVLEELLKGI